MSLNSSWILLPAYVLSRMPSLSVKREDFTSVGEVLKTNSTSLILSFSLKQSEGKRMDKGSYRGLQGEPPDRFLYHWWGSPHVARQSGFQWMLMSVGFSKGSSACKGLRIFSERQVPFPRTVGRGKEGCLREPEHSRKQWERTPQHAQTEPSARMKVSCAEVSTLCDCWACKCDKCSWEAEF